MLFRSLYAHKFEVVHKGRSRLGEWSYEFTIIKEAKNILGFDLYLVDIHGLLDREKVYGYDDDAQRFMAFQVSVLDWVKTWKHRPDIIHVHDYHSGLIPFMLKYCSDYSALSGIPSVLTIHNAEYQGWMGWDNSKFLPEYDQWKWGMLDWKNSINPLASAVKCAHLVTTVSKSYLDELKYMSNGLEDLFEYEKGKCLGILNGIDDEYWDPATDVHLDYRYSQIDVEIGKAKNKKH